MNVGTRTIESILLVDDDEINNFLNAMIIEETDLAHNIKTYTSAEKALQYLKESVKNKKKDLPELILLDVNMPEMDGWDFLEEYKKIIGTNLKRTKLMMLSSSMHERDVSKAKSYKFVVDYLPKPLNPSVIERIRYNYFKGRT
jgi:CheY-like chemotaxis protein